MFRERREMDGLRGERVEVVVVEEGGGLAMADGIPMARHGNSG
jgi:hypothetical protein